MREEYNEIFSRLYKINEKYKSYNISDVGCFELKLSDVRRTCDDAGLSSELIDTLFKRIDGEKVLSRNAIYYDFYAFHSYIDSFAILLAKAVENYETDESASYVLAALLDYYVRSSMIK